jgi:hypothetical protein
LVSNDRNSALTDPPGNQVPRIGIGWPGAIGVAISVILLWWTLRDVDFAELLGHLSRVNPLLMLGAVVAATIAFPLRTVRWRYLLQLEGKTLPFGPLWHATAIGFMASNLLPARAGEIARPYAAYRLTPVRFTTAAGTIALERVIDSVVLLAMLAGAATLGGFSVDTQIAGVAFGDLIVIGAVVSLAALLACLLAVLRAERTLSLARRALNLVLPRRWTDTVVNLLDGLFEGLSVLREPKRFAAVLVWSLIVWGVNGFSFLLALWALQINVPDSAAYVLQGVIALSVAIPSSPGFFGPFEAATRVTFSAYGISATEAAAYAAAYHLTTFVPITALGLWSLSRADLRLGDIRRVRRNAAEGTPAGEPIDHGST